MDAVIFTFMKIRCKVSHGIITMIQCQLKLSQMLNIVGVSQVQIFGPVFSKWFNSLEHMY
jgi:hypothetical protein